MTHAGNPLLDKFNAPHQSIPFNKIKISDYEPAFEKAIKMHDVEIDKIIKNKKAPDFANTIEALEYSGTELEQISAIFYNLLSAESNDEMMKISQRIQPKLTEHENDIMLNESLFDRIKVVYDQKDQLKLNKEQGTLLEKTYNRFVNNGANLSPENKTKYRELSSKLAGLTLNFGQNVLKATNAYSLILTDKDQLKGLPEDVIADASKKAESKGKEGWLFDLSAPSYIAFMKNASDRNLRKELYTAYNTRCMGGEFDNTEIIRNIINTRLEIANLIGYKTYAHQALKERMAGNVESVFELLNELLAGFENSARQEYREVQGFAIGKEKRNIEVMPYDWSYYADKLKDAKFELNDELTKPYFELENVKKGVFGLATQLYGISFKKNAKIPVYQEEVEAFDVFDEKGNFLAVLYTDFHPREGKRPGAWMTEYRPQEMRNGKNIRPLISIVMNFTRPTETKPALLTFDEVETFLHEFGHALHGIFANTTYPSLSGTSVYRDFVELPSQIMENFLLEKEYLDQFAVHYQTGEKIPAELVQKIIDASNFNAGYLCLRQLSFGLLDMAYHTITEPYTGEIAAFEHGAVEPTNVVPTIEGVMMSTAFSHIFSGGYAAGYYSYKWAEVLDADAYTLFQEKGIFNKEVAKLFHEYILSKGGTEDPMELYVRFRGHKPTTHALMKRSGIK
ncbi:M3 family metallopeptidase [Bacteroidales bacterium OttesenSCG-928-A17]|nr:M3 family metallopeptidase [Bacteroidales bacterium OttesenSCG-928-A17]